VLIAVINDAMTGMLATKGGWGWVRKSPGEKPMPDNAEGGDSDRSHETIWLYTSPEFENDRSDLALMAGAGSRLRDSLGR
jgi:hypothetical protein